MRFFEFAKPQQGESTVSKLVDIAKDPNVDPRLKNEILAILKQLETAGAQTDKKLANPQEQIATESTDAATIQTIESDEEYYQRKLNSDPRLKAVAEQKIKDAEAAGFKMGTTLSAKDVFSQFNTEVLSLVKNLKQLTPRFSDELKSIISHLATQGIEQDRLISFLKAAATPDRIIDLPLIVSKNGGGPLPIPEEYKDIVQAMVGNPARGSNASTGKGELLLTVLGKDTVKPEVGDIIVGKKPVEVKASDYTKGKKLTEFALGIQPVGKARTIMVNTMNKVLGRTIFLDATSTTVDEKTGVTGISSIGKQNLPKLNKFFQEMGQQQTQDMFRKMFLAVIGSKFSDDIEKIIASIDDNGIELEKMRQQVIELVFNYYKSVNGHVGILTVNIPNLTYNYVEDAETFASLENIKTGSLFNFRRNPSSITTFTQY